jgi:hypothetical protein
MSKATIIDIMRNLLLWLSLILFIPSLIGTLSGIIIRIVRKKKSRMLIYSSIVLALSIIIFVIIRATECTFCAQSVNF